MYMFNVTVDHQKLTIGCEAFQYVAEGPYAGYLQLIKVDNMQDDQFPDHEVDVLYLPFTCLNWFAQLRKKKVEKVEKSSSIQQSVEVLDNKTLYRGKRL